MSTETPSAPELAPAPSANPASRDARPPVVRPGKSAWKLFREVLDHGGPGYLQFAITNICNADCGFWGFARSKR